MITLKQALETVSQLPLEQQKMLLQIMGNRLIESRRKEIAQDAQKAIAAFHQGQLTPKAATEVIAELRESIDEKISFNW